MQDVYAAYQDSCKARSFQEREHLSHFLRIALRPDPTATASLRQLHERYPMWCREQSIDTLPPQELGQQLRSIVDAIGLECERMQIIVGVKVLKPGSPGDGEQLVPSHIGTTVRARLPVDVLAEAPEDSETTVGRTIVRQMISVDM